MVTMKLPPLPDSVIQESDLSAPAAKHVQAAIRAYQAGRLDEALDEWNKAMGLEAENALVFLGRALLYVNLGQYVEALADLSKARTLGLPANLDADLSAGNAIALHGLGRTKEAVGVLNEFLHHKDDPVLRKLRADMVNESLLALVSSGFAHWSGRKPHASTRTVKLTPGPSISEIIHEMRR